MFPGKIYTQRREKLRQLVGDGLILIAGNEESAMNYKANTYHFRQDSSFLYYFGINKPGFYGICDSESGIDTLFGNDFDIDDIIWMGEQPQVKELASNVGAGASASLNELSSVLKSAISSGRKIHILPPYRGDHQVALSNLASSLHHAHREASAWRFSEVHLETIWLICSSCRGRGPPPLHFQRFQSCSHVIGIR